jgi:hypothetical protein
MTGLTILQLRHIGPKLKNVRQSLIEIAERTRCYPGVSQSLLDTANALTLPRSVLESKLIELGVGRDEARDAYFGTLPTERAAE